MRYEVPKIPRERLFCTDRLNMEHLVMPAGDIVQILIWNINSLKVHKSDFFLENLTLTNPRQVMCSLNINILLSLFVHRHYQFPPPTLLRTV